MLVLFLIVFWEPTCIAADEHAFKICSSEEHSRFFGIDENVGHNIAFKILKDDTQKVICYFSSYSYDDSLTRNLRFYLDTIAEIVNHRKDTFEDDGTIFATPSALPDNDDY